MLILDQMLYRDTIIEYNFNKTKIEGKRDNQMKKKSKTSDLANPISEIYFHLPCPNKKLNIKFGN